MMPRTYSPTHFCRKKIRLGVTASRMIGVCSAHDCRHFNLIMITWGDFDVVTEMMMVPHRNTVSEMCSALQCAAGRINHR